MNTTIEALNFRYATKAFDTNKKLTDEQLAVLTESLRLSASSYGLQPWKFFVISNPELRAQLRAAAYDQSQITDASHLIVIATYKEMTPAHIDAFFASIAETRGIPADALQGYKDMVVGSASRLSSEQAAVWNAKQGYLALGTLLTTAALEKIDACPMEGFDAAKFNEILGLDAMGLTATVICPVGFRSEEDKTAAYKKVRFAAADVIVELK